MSFRLSLAAAAISLVFLVSPALAADYKVGDRLPTAADVKPGKFQEIGWDDLLPKDWDPMKLISGLNLDTLNDNDPRATEAMGKLREMWNSAPPNHDMKGKAVRIAGFLVPLEWGQKSLKEFLLVPYFGACVHVPPPPANQIIHVVAQTPYKPGPGGMDAVWVNGVLDLAASQTSMGDSGYRLSAVLVEPYKPPKPAAKAAKPAANPAPQR